MPDSTTTPPSLVLAGVRPWTGFQFTEPGPGGRAVPTSEPIDVHVAGGRIVDVTAAGRDRDGGGGRRVDGTGTWIGPGFVDAHVHLVMAGLGLKELDLADVSSRAEFERRIASEAARLDAGGRRDAWLVARGWDESRWGGERPTGDWLAAAGDRPAAAWRMDIHAAIVNQAGLARMDLESPVAGGTIERGPDGGPTGLLLEAAAWDRLIPVLPAPTANEERDAVRAAMTHAHARGVVAVGAMEYLDVVERALVPLADELTLTVRLLALDRELPLPIERMRAIPSSPALRLFAAKAFIDGTLGSRTARMFDPYDDAPVGDTSPRGLLVERALDGTLDAWASQASAAGLGVAMHAIGDEAVRLALDAADAARLVREEVLVRIEHAQHVHPDDLPRFSGAFASVQPGHRIADRAVMDHRLGARRAAAGFPLAELAAAGATLALGSDWPVIDCDPMDAIAAAVVGRVRDGHRRDGHEVDVAAALRGHTVDAWASIDEPGRGRLAIGADADLVLLDRDPGAIDWRTTIPGVAATIARGRLVFEG